MHVSGRGLCDSCRTVVDIVAVVIVVVVIVVIIIVAGKGGVQSSQYIVIDGTIGADSAAHDVDDNDV